VGSNPTEQETAKADPGEDNGVVDETGRAARMDNSKPDDPICPNCGGTVRVRNPTGRCDHLYWPDMLTPEAKAKIGQQALSEILRAICVHVPKRAALDSSVSCIRCAAYLGEAN
jgi:hypothetical protein